LIGKQDSRLLQNMMIEIDDIPKSQMMTLSKNFGCSSGKWFVEHSIQSYTK